MSRPNSQYAIPLGDCEEARASPTSAAPDAVAERKHNLKAMILGLHCEVLRTRIARKRSRHERIWDDLAHLRDTRTAQLQAECGKRRKHQSTEKG